LKVNLYYGQGECTIDPGGSKILGVEIHYTGNITVEKTASDNFVLINNNNGIVIFPIQGLNESLSDLFNYSGNMKIKSVLVADNNGEQVKCVIKKVMDYSELLDTNAEDLTTKSEEISAVSSSNKKIDKDSGIIKNQFTDGSSYNGKFYLSDGSFYRGAFHVHIKDNSCMTGAEHTEESQDLYFKQITPDGITINKLIPTKNPSHVPPAVTLKKRKRRRR